MVEESIKGKFHWVSLISTTFEPLNFLFNKSVSFLMIFFESFINVFILLDFLHVVE